MAFLLAVPAGDLALVRLNSLFPTGAICCIDSSGRDISSTRRASIGVFFIAFLSPVLFLLLPGLVGGLRVAGRIICDLGILDLVRLFNPGILQGNALGLHLGRGDVSGTIASLSSVAHLPDVGSRLEACFGLNLNRLLDYLFPDI